jgi:hypothetical protein
MGHYLPVRVCNGCWQRTTRTWLQPPRALKNHDHPEVPYCCICMSEPSSAIFIPCGHLCICTHCAKPMQTKPAACPLCRQFPTGVHQVFF